MTNQGDHTMTNQGDHTMTNDELYEKVQEKIDTWHTLLKLDDYEAVMKNVKRHVLEKKFPPTVAEIKENKNPAYRNDILSKLTEWEREASGKPNS